MCMIEISFTSSAPKFNIHLQDENLAPALHLIERWYEGDESFTFYSSGSTGTPKPVVLKREFLIASAKRTIQLFSISSNDTLLLALNTSFMGGMMMVIRAIIAQCNLIYIPPNKLNSDILRKLPEIKLASFVPVQVNDLLSQKINPFVKIRNILLGGAPISSDLENKIHELESYSLFYHTYGMTETASHVAIRDLASRKMNTIA
jgi:O-succinylbenzoic acid--CoA ligase